MATPENTIGLYGVTIKWLNRTPNYSDLKPEIDYVIVKSAFACPNYYGDPIQGLAEDEEWLAISSNAYPSDYTPEMYKVETTTLPTNQKHPDFPNYNMYLTKYDRVLRNEAELIESILQIENEANMSIQSESEKAKMAQLAPCIAAKYGNSPLNDPEQAVYNRMIEVGDKVFANAANATQLIAIVKNNADITKTPRLFDIKSGWIYDNITPQGFPLENSVV